MTGFLLHLLNNHRFSLFLAHTCNLFQFTDKACFSFFQFSLFAGYSLISFT